MDPLSLGLLAVALSLDSLTVGLLYGVRGIRLSLGAITIVSMATGVLLLLAMAGGQLIASRLPPTVAQRAGALLLIVVGIWVTYNTWRNSKPRKATRTEPTTRHDLPQSVMRFRFGSVGIVIEILREPGAADVDQSGHISSLEAFFLGIALAMDSVAAGLSASMAGYSPVSLPLAAAAASFGLMLLGSRGAKLIPIRLDGPWAVLHGIVLVGLGLYRMAA